MKYLLPTACAVWILLPAPLAATSVRLKELISVEGVRDNQLVGYGIVVGLNGTGDKRQTIFSTQSLSNMLERMGVSVPAASFQVKNAGAVIVTATLPPFAQTGTRIDVTAAAIGDASNLQGGLLVMTPLRAADGQVYAVAQGAVVTGGFVAGRGGNTQTVNHPTVGRILSGALVERAPPSVPIEGKSIHLQLKNGDFMIAAKIADVINQTFATPGLAKADNPGRVTITVPASYETSQVEFLARIEALSVSVDAGARIVINERTGTIVIGKDVALLPVSIMHGALNVQIESQAQVSQPMPLSDGQTVASKQTKVTAKEDKAAAISLKAGATVEDLVKALQAIGSTARDIIVILQNLRAAGSLEAEIEVI